MKLLPESIGYRPIIYVKKEGNELDPQEVLKNQWVVIKNSAIWVLLASAYWTLWREHLGQLCSRKGFYFSLFKVRY